MLDWKRTIVADNAVFYLRYGERELALGIMLEPGLFKYRAQWRVYKDDNSGAEYTGFQDIDPRFLQTRQMLTREDMLNILKPSIDHGMIAMLHVIAEKFV